MFTTFHSKDTPKGFIAILHGDIEAARRFFEPASKGLNSINVPSNTPQKTTRPRSSETPKPMPHISFIDIDNCFTKDDYKEEKKIGKLEAEASSTPNDGKDLAHPRYPIPDGEFKGIILNNNPNKEIKIGTAFPDLVRR